MLITDLKGHYRTGQDDLRRDFFVPCLTDCLRYRRAAGYFRSSALISWAEALTLPSRLDRFNANVLISPKLQGGDLVALEQACDPTVRSALLQRASDQVMVDILELLEADSLDEAQRLQAQILTWLLARGKLEIRFAFPEHIDDAGIFHEKIGIFDFPDNTVVAFTGSANESLHGHSKNYESVDVYRNWLPEDAKRVSVKVDQFEEAWSGKAAGLEVKKLSAETLEQVRSYITRKAIDPTRVPHPPPPEVPDKWAHQEEAVNIFLNARRGVLEMATGTGKTRTAIKAMTRLLRSGEINGIIISTEGVDLLDQWVRELDDWTLTLRTPFRVLRHYGSHHDLAGFSNNPASAVICISRSQLGNLFRQLDSVAKQKLLVIHDEVHGLGSPASRLELAGSHREFPYCLGLSATPEREYDNEGTQFITDEIGPVIFRFELQDAIQLGILCEFEYMPLPYTLTDGDRQRLQQVYLREAARKAAGNPMSQEEVWIELARVYKTAELKPAIFDQYLRTDENVLQSAIIFVDDRAYGDRVIDVIAKRTYRYRTYYADDDRENLLHFGAGDIDTLVTCHRISQGIDIRGLRAVILFSSARSRLETVQRIGRCLRTDPGQPYKRALVVDFIRNTPDGNQADNPDAERKSWLADLAKVRARI